MYSQIPDLDNKIENILENAYQAAFKERDEFFTTPKGSIIQLIVEYIKENNIVIATNNNIVPQKIKNNKVMFESYKFTLFHTNALVLCNDLINYLFLKTETDLLMMRSLSYNEFIIKYDDIEIVMIYGMPIYQNINLLKVMNLEIINGVNVLPCEIEIINSYKKISDLSNDNDYYYYSEKELYERFINSQSKDISNDSFVAEYKITGGKNKDHITVHDEYFSLDKLIIDKDQTDNKNQTDNKDQTDNMSQSEESREIFTQHLPLNMIQGGSKYDLTELREIIVDKFISKYGCLLGEAALNVYENSFENISHRDLKLNYPFEALVEMDINDIVKELNKILKLDIQYKNNINRLPFDFRNIRHTLSYEIKDETYVLCHIYNDATYNVVPYTKLTFNKKLYNIAMPSMIMKYLFINLWVDKFRFIVKSKQPINNKHLVDIIKRTHLFYEKFSTMEEINKSMDVSYIGTYLDEITAKKKKMLTDSSYPYYVKSYFIKYGKVREIVDKSKGKD